jgi:phenylalanyl-tRNA synthetase beta subunit
VREDVAAGDVAASIRRSAGPNLTDLRLFDVYRGSPARGRRRRASRTG